MAKTSVKFQNDWPKTVGGVALTSQLLTNGQTDEQMNGRVMARLYHTCVLTQVPQKGDLTIQMGHSFKDSYSINKSL